MFYVRVNKLKSWISICKEVLQRSLLSSRDLFSVLITGGCVCSVEKQTLSQTLLEDRNVIPTWCSAASEHAVMMQLKNSPTNSTFRLIKFGVIAKCTLLIGGQSSATSSVLHCTQIVLKVLRFEGLFHPWKLKSIILMVYKKKITFGLEKQQYFFTAGMYIP